MKDEIKEILDYLNIKGKKMIGIKQKELLLDYITNLQEENEFLKLNNPEMNMEHFRIIKENKRKIDNFREENKRLKELCDKYEEEHSTAFKLWTMKMEEMPCCEEFMNYKSRNEKALDKLYCYGEVFDSKILQQFQKEMENILQGDDECE